MPNNQWGTVRFEVPDFLEDLRGDINSVAELYTTYLSVANLALEFCRTFLVGYLDPIAALVQAIVQEINALITDMRQLGLYITGDWGLLEWPPNKLQGGFQEYQRRMISRLTDLTDPTRPNVSEATKVLSMFFYLSADASDVQRLVAFVRQLASFFGVAVTPHGSLPTVSPIGIQYGANAVDILHPKSLVDAFEASATPPSMAKVSWTLNSPARTNPFNPLPPLPPGGFIVTVSTLENGLQIVYDVPQADTALAPGTADPTVLKQPRDYGQVQLVDMGDPVILFGGADMAPSSSLVAGLSYNYPDSADQGRSRVYALPVDTSLGDGVIPIEELHPSNDVYLLQRAFYVPTLDKLASWARGQYGFVLAAEDMPYTCTWEFESNGTLKPHNIERAKTAYIRIASCTADAYDQQLKYRFLPPDAKGGQLYVGAAFFYGLSGLDLSAWSRPVRVTFPGPETLAYLEALKAALLVLVLSRPDLVLYDPTKQSSEVQARVNAGTLVIPNAVLATCGLEGMKHLAGMVFEDYTYEIQKKGLKPTEFREALLGSIERVVHDIYNMTGSNPQVEKYIVEQTLKLRTVTWGNIFSQVHPTIELPTKFKTATLLQSVDAENSPAGADVDNGIGANPYSIGVLEDVVREWIYVPNLISDRDPQMMVASTGGVSTGFSKQMVVPAAEAASFLAGLAPGLQQFYEPHWDENGIHVPIEYQPYLDGIASRNKIEGSADLSPVFCIDREFLATLNAGSPFNAKWAGLFYCRGLFAKYLDGQLFQESAIALSLAAAAIRRSPQDGQWLNFRFFESFPAMDDFFSMLSNWAEALQGATQSIVDSLQQYIDFLEGRLVELQQLIKRINDLLQNMLGFIFQIPQCGFLAMTSNGTMGVTTDLVNATNKPADSPLAYGAGLALVIPYGPAVAMNLLQSLYTYIDAEPDPTQTLAAEVPAIPAAIGIEDLPAPPAPPPDPPPDVL